MWNVLPKFGLFKIIFVLFSIAVTATIIFLLPEDKLGQDFIFFDTFIESIKICTPISIIFITFYFILGKFVWKIFWNIPLLGSFLNKHICPNLNGKWEGLVHSNYINEIGQKVTKQVLMVIKADFFGFEISLESNDRYQKSKVTFCNIYKDKNTNTYYLSYLYSGEVPFPEESDDRIYDGSAKLEIIYLENGCITLDGIYWTNRAWQRKLNTAGRITFSKVT